MDEQEFFLTLLLCTLFFGCGTSQQAPQLPDGALPWSSQRKIMWSDFQGTPISSGGQTACEISLQSSRYALKGNIFSKSVDVGDCYMDRKHSWVDTSKATVQLLLYNQTMFDIYELYMRKLRQKYDETSFGLGDPSELFYKTAEENQAKLQDELKAFRTETKLGQDSLAINSWALKVSNELSTLSRYERK